MKLSFAIVILVVGTLLCGAQLAVRVTPVKVTGQTAVVPLALKNGLAERVESARTAVFLLDEQGKIVAQGTRWVIGGEPNKPGLASGVTNSFNFVIASDKPFTSTNLTAKVSFTRIVLEGGNLADVRKDVIVTPTAK